jgi:HTH-type transcriptional regulator/antitoxin HigA
MRSTPFTPDWASPPGETILDLLVEQGRSHEAMAQCIGVSPKRFRALLQGRLPINEHIAERLVAGLCGTPEFRLQREARYRARLISQQAPALPLGSADAT